MIRRLQTRGFALVITLILVVMAAIIVIALLTGASLDRVTAHSYNDRFRAESAAQSGLAAALSALSGRAAPVNFQYITAVGESAPPVLVPLDYKPSDGTVTANTTVQRLLLSQGSLPAILTLSTATNPKVTRQAGYVSLSAPDAQGASQEVERYAFYIDEGGSRQNLSVQGGSSRVNARDPGELPLLSAASPVPMIFTTAQMDAIKNDRPLLLTPATANRSLSANAVIPSVDSYAYATASAVTNLAPDGKPRVDLQRLKSYVDGLSVDQASGNLRATLVTRLLDPNEAGTDWGEDDGSGGRRSGGNLAIINKLTRYNATQAKQIVANILDYIDSDLIPTTDNVDSPAFFGVEGRADSSGKVVGHPYINFVGTGLVFNRSSAAGFQGGLNSTRVLVVLGLINPWSSPTKDWPTFYVQPEIEVSVTGDAAGGNLGSRAQDYFHSVFTTTESSNQLQTYPTATIDPNKGYAFPSPSSAITNYATFYDILNTNGRQPAGMVFSNLGFQISKLRLKFTDTDGRSGYVQVLDNLKLTAQPANPTSVDLDHSGKPSSLVYKFAIGAPDKVDFHLASDPRLNFTSDCWILSKSTETGANPPVPATTVNVFSAADAQNWDYNEQSPSVTDHLWYTDSDATSSFYVKSPPVTGVPAIDSTGELGFIHTGIPWETLRFYVTGEEQNGKERDRELLAYTQSGTLLSADYGAVPTAPGKTAPPVPIPLLSGPLNINTNKPPTLQSLFLGATAKADADAAARADGTQADPDVTTLATALAQSAGITLLPLPGDFLNLQPVREITRALGPADFDREVLARRTANMLGTQSTRFTVYSLGEARDNAQTTSTVNLRAEVELQTDETGRPIPKVLNMAYYLAK